MFYLVLLREKKGGGGNKGIDFPVNLDTSSQKKKKVCAFLLSIHNKVNKRFLKFKG